MMNRRTKRLFVGAMWATLALALVVIAVFVLGACAAVKPACQIIRVADDACDVFEVTLKDGSKERVSVAAVQRLGENIRTQRRAIERFERGGE